MSYLKTRPSCSPYGITWESTQHRAHTVIGRPQSIVTDGRTHGCTEEEDKLSLERQLLARADVIMAVGYLPVFDLTLLAAITVNPAATALLQIGTGFLAKSAAWFSQLRFRSRGHFRQ